MRAPATHADAALDSLRIQLPRRHLVVVTFALILANVLSALDSTIVATAMPRIITELSGLEYYAWVTTAYLVASTTMVPISGKLGDLFGRKRFLLGAKRSAQIRIEAFNALNQPAYGPPGRALDSPNTFGVITTTINTPRTLELVAKFAF